MDAPLELMEGKWKYVNIQDDADLFMYNLP